MTLAAVWSRRFCLPLCLRVFCQISSSLSCPSSPHRLSLHNVLLEVAPPDTQNTPVAEISWPTDTGRGSCRGFVKVSRWLALASHTYVVCVSSSFFLCVCAWIPPSSSSSASVTLLRHCNRLRSSSLFRLSAQPDSLTACLSGTVFPP